MATFNITAAAYWDDLAGKAGGDILNVQGGYLTVRTDTRWEANMPAALVGSFAGQTIEAARGGTILYDGRNVRWMPFTRTSATNVPAIGTTITQGGVSGYLLGVWASVGAAPTAVGAAIPATGFLKFREVTGGAFAAGALTGITCDADSPDVAGWIEIVGNQNSAITVPRKGYHLIRGQWFYLTDTNGSAGQVIDTPAFGSGANSHCPGVWVETAPASGVYEFWPSLVAAQNWKVTDMGQPYNAVDARMKFVKSIGNGQVQFGEDVFEGTASAYATVAETGTYNLPGSGSTQLVVSRTAHGYTVGDEIYLEFTSGGGISGYYTIIQSTNDNSFAVTHAAGAVSGNVTIRGRVLVTPGGGATHDMLVGQRVHLETVTGGLTTGNYEVEIVNSTTSYTIWYRHSADVSGTATRKLRLGLVPASGCKVRMPNVLLRVCTTAARASNAAPGGTLQASSYRWVVNGGGVLDVEYCSCQFALYSLDYAYSIKLYHFAYWDRLGITKAGTPIDLSDGGHSSYVIAAYQNDGFAVANQTGGTVVNWSCQYGGAKATYANDDAIALTACSDLTFTNVIAGKIAADRINTTGVAVMLAYCEGVTFNGLKTINQRITMIGCSGVAINDLDHCGRYAQNWSLDVIYYVVQFTQNCVNCTVDGVTCGFGNTIPNTTVSRFFYIANCTGIKIRNVGSVADPVLVGSWPRRYPTTLFYSDGGLVNCKSQRWYVDNFTHGAPTYGYPPNPFYQNVTDVGLIFEHIYIVQNYLAQLFHYRDTNTITRSVGGNFLTTAVASVYGSNWMDIFISATAGYVVLFAHEGNFTLVAGVSGFTGSGTLAMLTLNDEVIFESNYWIKGHTALRNAALTFYGTNQSNHSFEFQIDTGSGWNGTWLALTGANLSAQTISPTGFKLKYRIVCTTASATNAIIAIRIDTDSTQVAQDGNLHPLDTANVTVTNVVAGSRIKITKTSDGSLLANEYCAGTSLTIALEYTGEVRIDVRKGTGSPAYKPWYTIATVGAGVSVTALQESDS